VELGYWNPEQARTCQQLFVSVTGCNSIVEMLTFTSFKDLLIKRYQKAEGWQYYNWFRFYKSHCGINQTDQKYHIYGIQEIQLYYILNMDDHQDLKENIKSKFCYVIMILSREWYKSWIQNLCS